MTTLGKQDLGVRNREETGLFRVEDGFEEQDADGGVDDVVAGELGDPRADVDGVELGGDDTGGGLHHHEEGG